MIDEQLCSEIGAGFDHAAHSYDGEIGGNLSMQYMRRVSLAVLEASFSEGQQVLEVGCGTGEEALALARRGVRVVATDLSAEMVAIAREKVRTAELDHLVEVCQIAASDLNRLVDVHGASTFDGAYSSFGALNGERDLGGVGRSLCRLLRPHGRVVVSVMSRWYVFEVCWFLSHGRPIQAARRWRGHALAHVSPSLTDRVLTWYYTPRAFARSWAPDLYPVSCQALPFLLPPPYAAHLWHRYPWILRQLQWWETALSTRWPFRSLGDHFLMVLQRT